MPAPDDIPSAVDGDREPAFRGVQNRWPEGWSVTVVDETGSTNDDVLAAAAEGAADRTVLCARHQRSGRGRLDRRWDAPPGANLLVSMLFRDVPDEAHQLTQRVGLAACQVASSYGVDARLKWPNDVVVGDAKLAGILAQAGDGFSFVVVGLGLNVGWAPPGAASLRADGDGRDGVVTADVIDVLGEVLRAYDALPGDITDLYRRSLSTIGRRVRVELHDAVLLGTAVDVRGDGALVVRDDSGLVHEVHTADVVHLRAAEYPMDALEEQQAP